MTQRSEQHARVSLGPPCKQFHTPVFIISSLPICTSCCNAARASTWTCRPTHSQPLMGKTYDASWPIQQECLLQHKLHKCMRISTLRSNPVGWLLFCTRSRTKYCMLPGNFLDSNRNAATHDLGLCNLPAKHALFNGLIRS